MSFRAFVMAGSVLAGVAPAMAGGADCGGQCFRETTLSPIYGTVAERMLLSPPRTVDVVAPARYATVTETVQVGGGRVWQVKRDKSGRRVGCWVDTPPRFETRPRTVMVSAAYSEPHTYPAVYGSRERTVLVEPGRRAWVPVNGAVAGGPAGPVDFAAGAALGAADLGLGIAGLGVSAAVDTVGVAGGRRTYRRY